jgi:hypothetical protein
MFSRKGDNTAAAMTIVQFHEALDRISEKHGRSENFARFMEAAYCSQARQTAPSEQRAAELEARFAAVARSYESNDDLMARMAYLLHRLAYTVARYRGDFLAQAYAESLVASERTDHYDVIEATLRGCLPQSHFAALLSSGRPITLHLDGLSASTQAVAMATHLTSMGFNPRHTLYVELIAPDPLAYQMAFLTCNIRDIPALCIGTAPAMNREFDRAFTVAGIYQRQWLTRRTSSATSDNSASSSGSASERAAQPGPDSLTDSASAEDCRRPQRRHPKP